MRQHESLQWHFSSPKVIFAWCFTTLQSSAAKTPKNRKDSSRGFGVMNCKSPAKCRLHLLTIIPRKSPLKRKLFDVHLNFLSSILNRQIDCARETEIVTNWSKIFLLWEKMKKLIQCQQRERSMSKRKNAIKHPDPSIWIDNVSHSTMTRKRFPDHRESLSRPKLGSLSACWVALFLFFGANMPSRTLWNIVAAEQDLCGSVKARERTCKSVTRLPGMSLAPQHSSPHTKSRFAAFRGSRATLKLTESLIVFSCSMLVWMANGKKCCAKP